MKQVLKLLSLVAGLCALTCSAHAAYGVVDHLSLAPFVPLVLDAFMSVAMAGYDFFVGNGTGIIYILVWGWLAFYICMYLVKMYFPENWLKFFGLSQSADLWGGKVGATDIGMGVLKPMLRAIIAVTLLLQVRPQYVTDFIVDPFLRFGAIYTESIRREVVQGNSWGGAAPEMKCPEEIVAKGYMSAESCQFLVQPVADVTHANNIIIKRGLDFFMRGLRGMITLIPHGGEDFMNLVTGAILVVAFVSSNFFMALLIIQGLFWFGMALIMYPFKVLTYVTDPKGENKDSWFNPWPAFDGIVDALKVLVITMIASMFIMLVNIAAIRALFNWDNSVYVPVAEGSAHSNLPAIATGSSIGFGQHSITWLSAILTFYLMFRIFDLTREKLKDYTAGNKPAMGKDDLYKTVTGDAKATWKNTKKWSGKVVQATEWGKDTKLGKWVGKKLGG